ncbi:methyl-accepting chemotaxis protein [Devosia sp.]|uniref:methyl-accepting chemotaxis protein n=1 Tax=Devosia sp. TaxID=1871048 RepID=UPI003A912159
MGIKARIFSIVGVMGVLICLVGGAAVFASLQYSDKLSAIENATERAYDGERLNRIVTAVVMDSRGIYASDTVEQAAPFAEKIVNRLAEMDAHLAAWRELVPASELEDFDRMVANAAEFKAFRSETARLGLIDPELANAQGNNADNRANRRAFQDEIDLVVAEDQQRSDAVSADMEQFQAFVIPAVIGITAFGLLAGLASAWFVATHYITRPLSRMTQTMATLAEGNFTVDVPFAGRSDEIGHMANAVQVFKDNGIRVAQMNEDERIQNEKAVERAQTMTQFQAEFDEVVDSTLRGDLSKRVEGPFSDQDITRVASNFNGLMDTVDSVMQRAGDVLEALAEADLTRRMEGDYQGDFARLKDSTNTVATKLADIVTQLRSTSGGLKTATGEILAGANDLSERTTKQAATIEETSAAMEQLSQTVMANAERASSASENAAEVTTAAEAGGSVMMQANEAMERITQSSSKISNIIGMIDDIAFQTNLLALNASVEAARAGEAGKGFAVVAVEVRRLAQSAAEASSEVKALIEQSANEVGSGSRLVAQAAEKLGEMQEAVKRNRDLLDGIARESREQASSIDEVNTAVRQMDEMTQHNAALVEQTNAAIEQTESQATELDRIVAVFRVGNSHVSHAAEGARQAPANSNPTAKPGGIKALQKKVTTAAKAYLNRGSAAVQTDEWAEF